MMDKLIEDFPQQLLNSFTLAKAIKLTPYTQEVTSVYLAGLGGSGIGGNYTQDIIRKECKIPMVVGKGYSIPTYVGSSTLFIASSYSGNTEETLSALNQAMEQKANILCITTGGKVAEIAKANNFNLILLPKGEPVPRAYLGASLVHVLGAMIALDIVDEGLWVNVRSAIDLINYDQDDIKEKAKKTAEALYGRIPLIYVTERMESVALRLRQQINENAKQLCWHGVVPEMNHNELVGWGLENNKVSVLYLRNKDDYKRNDARIELNKEIIGKKADSVIEVFSKGNSLIEKMIYFTHLGDWISYYLGVLNKIDLVEVDVIDYLKSELKKLQ